MPNTPAKRVNREIPLLGAVISTGLGGPPVQLKPVLLSPVVKSSLPGKVGRQLHWFFGERFLPVGQIYLPFLGQIMGVIDVSEGGFNGRDFPR